MTIVWALIFLLNSFRFPLVPKETKGRLCTPAATPGSPPAYSAVTTSVEWSFKNAHLTTPFQCPYPHPGLNFLNNWLPTALVTTRNLQKWSMLLAAPLHITPHTLISPLWPSWLPSHALAPLCSPLSHGFAHALPSPGCSTPFSRQNCWSNSKGQAFCTNHVASSLNILCIIQQKESNF